MAARWMKAQRHGRDKVISGSGRALPPFHRRLKTTKFSPLVRLECSNTGLAASSGTRA